MYLQQEKKRFKKEIKSPDNPGLEAALKIRLHRMWIMTVQTLSLVSHDCRAAGLREMCARGLPGLPLGAFPLCNGIIKNWCNRRKSIRV